MFSFNSIRVKAGVIETAFQTANVDGCEEWRKGLIPRSACRGKASVAEGDAIYRNGSLLLIARH